MSKDQFLYNHNLLRSAVLDAFSGLNIGDEIGVINLDSGEHDFGFSVCIDFISDPIYTLTIELEVDLANLVAQTMFFCDGVCQEYEIHDASKELVNIVAGGIEHGFGNGWALSPPMVLDNESYDAIKSFLVSQASLVFVVNNEHHLRVTLWSKK